MAKLNNWSALDSVHQEKEKEYKQNENRKKPTKSNANARSQKRNAKYPAIIFIIASGNKNLI